MDLFTSLLLGLIVCVPILYFYQKASDDKKATKINLDFNSSANELTLHKRDSTNRKVLSVTEVWNHTFNYEPEKIVYTGATVGGVHTGGFHKEGGYHTVSGTSTGMYQIWYDNGVAYETNYTSGGVNKVLLANHIKTCVTRDIQDGKEETVDELVATLQKLMK